MATLALRTRQENICINYLGYVGQMPDLPGLRFWEEEYARILAATGDYAGTMREVCRSIYVGFLAHNQVPELDKMNNDNFVRSLYENLFERTPEPEGLGYWTAEILKGRKRSELVGVMAFERDSTRGDWPYVLRRVANFLDSSVRMDVKPYLTMQSSDVVPARADRLEFSTPVQVGTTRQSQTVYLMSRLSPRVVVTSVASDSVDFTVVQSGVTSVTAGKRVGLFTIGFTPRVAGKAVATIGVMGNYQRDVNGKNVQTSFALKMDVIAQGTGSAVPTPTPEEPDEPQAPPTPIVIERMVQLTNLARSTLAVAISATATTIRLRAGDGAKFPNLTAGQWFPLALENELGQIEFLKAVSRNGDDIVVQRGQENTTARAYSAGDLCDLRLTVAALAEYGGSGYTVPTTPTTPKPEPEDTPVVSIENATITG